MFSATLKHITNIILTNIKKKTHRHFRFVETLLFNVKNKLNFLKLISFLAWACDHHTSYPVVFVSAYSIIDRVGLENILYMAVDRGSC